MLTPGSLGLVGGRGNELDVVRNAPRDRQRAGVGGGSHRIAIAHEGDCAVLDGAHLAQEAVGLHGCQVGLGAVHDDEVEVVERVRVLGGDVHIEGRGVLLGGLLHGGRHLHPQVGQEGGTRVGGGVVAELGRIAFGGVAEGSGLALDLRVLGDGIGHLLLQVGHKRVALGLFADGCGVDRDSLAPGCAPGDLRVGHGGGDLAQLVVVLLGDAGVGGQDDLGLGGADLLEGGAAGLVEELGLRGALGDHLVDLLLGPGQHAGAVGDAPVLLGEADRHDAQCQEDVLVGPGNGGDLGGVCGNLGGAVDVLDRDGLSGGAG